MPSDVSKALLQPRGVPRDKRLTLFALMSLAYFLVSGGAFGIEALIGAIGPGWAVILIVVAPIIWSLPMALMVAELATLMPEEGGRAARAKNRRRH